MSAWTGKHHGFQSPENTWGINSVVTQQQNRRPVYISLPQSTKRPSCCLGETPKLLPPLSSNAASFTTPNSLRSSSSKANRFDGRVAELADAQDLKSCVRLGRAGSSPASATNDLKPEIPAANRTPNRNKRQSHEKGVPIKVRLFFIVSFKPELDRV